MPLTMVTPRTRRLFRFLEALSGRLPGERLELDGGGQAYVYRPKTPPSTPAPGVLWIHGDADWNEDLHATEQALEDAEAATDELEQVANGLDRRTSSALHGLVTCEREACELVRGRLPTMRAAGRTATL